MNYRVARFWVFILFFAGGSFLSVHNANATHIRAGEITVQRNSCSSLSFTITITVYTNVGSVIRFSNGNSGELKFGDGSPTHHPPQKENSPVPGFNPDVYGFVSYSITHVFPGPGQYVISYFEHNRNEKILNMTNSVEVPFYVETLINIDPFLGCDNSPRLSIPPIDKACSGAAFFHNPGAYDTDYDSLSYEMTIPKSDVGTNVPGYSSPTSQSFYAALGNYPIANEAHNDIPRLTIDPIDGTLKWDAPGAIGEYNIAFIIKEWRKIGGIWVMLGYVTRDMQIQVEDCDNLRPELTVPPEICVEAGTKITATILGFDTDLDSVKIEAFSQVFAVNPSPASYTSEHSFPPVYQSCTPDSAKLHFQWQTQCEHIKEQPYQVVFKITDNPPPDKGASLVEFKTWSIRVVGPAPKWRTATLANKKASLVWSKYTCANASVMEVWRRIDSNDGAHADCETGMPARLGYSKIAEVPIKDTTYLDTNNSKGLAPGAVYCYRLVAVFPAPQGGESYVSDQICIPQVPATAPIITNVTIDKTDPANGIITVKWVKPYEADTNVYHPPFSYEIYRAEGFSGLVKVTAVNPGKQPETFVVDNDPLNTAESVYNYRVVAYDNVNTPMDTSATASSVRLEVKPQLGQIELNWIADVPWSNQSVASPWHVVYRGKENDTEAQLIKIDSVNVNGAGFHYIDSGQYQHQPLKETELYCYRVMTRGGYGNPNILEPLENFSEIICAQPNDSVAPCRPKLTIKGTDCKKGAIGSTCGLNTFSNTVTWNKPDDVDCMADTRSYNIYIAPEVGADFSLFATNVRDTFFIDANLASFARCYKITAVDRSGNESDQSESFCFDNCPYYELPNVFTPNGDNCNDLFSAFHVFAIDENGFDGCGTLSPEEEEERESRCARFVDHVTLTVVNRWGKEVYTYESGGERSILIDWDGKDNGGKDVPPGIYYYVAAVDFLVVDPSQRHKNIKGWVQLVR